ncbi:winged helix-turn-helix transcriptional regulator [Sphingomonas kyeonggiensis]|uniref:DNA-binding HxlR family transcriptional regulator n=2 Tax=Sphingomonas kyeonggiensis TaxID=1268553 RepID=A0A7W6JTU9_9SPHN|nr:helix-turn-helix domain-containing protein [Sphingomonas kyeonggiensis]MBB4099464.1 DNA-binding HxlR family transcriptional regulator [Sphingomonas kyeonggiensis]MBB4841273.1 DNA-binding HxlR family transcriptional regulator [Sphingomonas kyeonggiensis]
MSEAAAIDPAISADDPLEPLEGRWVLRILICLNAGAHRFADLRSAIPRVSANILTDRLRTLECAGLVERRYLPAPYASHVYALTEVATSLKTTLDGLASWRASQSKMSIPSRRPGKEQSR